MGYAVAAKPAHAFALKDPVVCIARNGWAPPLFLQEWGKPCGNALP